LTKVRRWLRTPKALTIAALLILAAFEIPYRGASAVAGVLVVGAVCGIVDAALTRFLTGRPKIPDGAVTTGLIVSLVVDPTVPLWVPLVASIAGLVVKQLARTHWSNIFNPAAVGLLAAVFIGGSLQSWWGGLADLPAPFLLVLILTGGFIANRENKLPAVLTFLGVYTLLLTAVSVSRPDQVAGAFRVPDVNAALFFALFMVTDPPTSPVRYAPQIAFGLVTATIALFGLLLGAGIAHFPLALLAANGLESWRRPRGRTEVTLGQ
jgi:enediyne biosynthesis protein E5